MTNKQDNVAVNQPSLDVLAPNVNQVISSSQQHQMSNVKAVIVRLVAPKMKLVTRNQVEYLCFCLLNVNVLSQTWLSCTLNIRTSVTGYLGFIRNTKKHMPIFSSFPFDLFYFFLAEV